MIVDQVGGNRIVEEQLKETNFSEQLLNKQKIGFFKFIHKKLPDENGVENERIGERQMARRC